MDSKDDETQVCMQERALFKWCYNTFSVGERGHGFHKLHQGMVLY